MELGDYLAVLGRRKISFSLTFLAILISGLVIAFTLPSIYRSEATILIERADIPQDLVATTVTGYVQERIEGIRQRLVTYENMVALAEKQNLFPEMQANGDISNMVIKIRQSISVAMVDIKSGNTKNTSTVAFTVGFEANNAATAQKVAEELAEQYLEANKRARSEQTADVSEFLEQEAERLRQEISQLEKSLAEFKQEQSSQLPELLSINMRLYEKTEGQIDGTKDRIFRLEDKIIALESELSLTDPRKAVRTDDGKIVQSPSERLSGLASEYLQARVKYAPSHPDVVRLRREIQALGSQSSDAAKVSDLVNKLTLLQSQLLDAQQKYASEHPDVLKVKKSIAAVENQLRNINLIDNSESTFTNVPADNPRYVALKTQLDTTRSNLEIEKVKLGQYAAKLQEYEKRLFQTPIVERDYQELTRDYGNAKKKYTELRNKQMEARLAEQLEAGEKSERFVLEGAAFYPTSPVSPNRLGIALLSIMMAFGGGIGAIGLAEFRDGSVRGSKGVYSAFGALPIVVIPYIENKADISRQKKSKLIWMSVILIGVILAVVSLYMFLGGS